MIDNIKKTLKHAAVYGLGNVATKLIGVVLLPLYTKNLSVAEYGVLGILEISILILTQILMLGQPFAYLRFHDLEKDEEKKRSALFTLAVFLFSLGLAVNIIGQIFTVYFASFFSDSQSFVTYFRYSLFVVHLQILNLLFLNVLRVKERSGSYAGLLVFKLLVMLLCNVYFVAVIRVGVIGILYSYFIGEALLFILLIPFIGKEMNCRFDKSILRSSLIVGAPLITVSLTNMVLNMGDRYVLKLLVDYEEVGLYNLGYKVAGLMNMLLIQSFNLIYLPLAHKMYGKPGDKRYYSKMLTYLMFVLVWSGLVIALFNREIIELFSLNTDYYAASVVIPYIVFAYILSGSKSVINLGLYLKGKTQIIALTMIAAAVVNIGLNFLLIPQFKMIGAAVATILAFIMLLVLTWHYSRKCYDIPYEISKILKLLLLFVIFHYISVQLNDQGLGLRIGVKAVLIGLFPFLLRLLNFYEAVELEKIKYYFNKCIRRIEK